MAECLGDAPIEFDCIECGRHILSFGAPLPQPKLCAACLMLPGWFTDPELARVIDPDCRARPPQTQ